MAKVFWLGGDDESFLTGGICDDCWDDDTVVDTCVTFVTVDVDVVVVCDVTTGGDLRFFSGSGLGSFWAWDGFTDSGTFIELINEVMTSSIYGDDVIGHVLDGSRWHIVD